MIFYNGVMKTKVVWNQAVDMYDRLATGEKDVNVDSDDAVFVRTDGEDLTLNETLPERYLVIDSLAQLRKVFRKKLVMTWVLALLFWCVLAVMSWRTAMAYFQDGMVWYRFLPIGVFIILATLYTAQAFNPVVHDTAGKWVHLRTGSTNLHDGCCIHPRRRRK